MSDFFPRINRRTSYTTKKDGSYYSDYKKYHDEISEDCEYRCVYCDILLSELGFEGMQLDHFKPKKKFPLLANDPKNLVLSCQKCNRNKSDSWHENVDKIGFIDPFIANRDEYFSVTNHGIIIPLKHPSLYMSMKLRLNRLTRIQVRRNRIIKRNKEKTLAVLKSKIEDTHEIPKEKLTEIKSLLEQLSI